MQQLLPGQRRLPGFSGAWDVKSMRALGNTYGGLTGKTKKISATVKLATSPL